MNVELINCLPAKQRADLMALRQEVVTTEIRETLRLPDWMRPRVEGSSLRRAGITHSAEFENMRV